MKSAEIDLLVIGAGPTGLTTACEARRHGLSVRVVERKETRSMWSKALVVHARTMEAFEAMGVIDAVRGAGVPFRALNVTATPGKPSTRVDLMELEWGDTRYPYWLAIPQYETERCLEEHLVAQGGAVEWGVRFDGLVEHADHVEAQLVHSDGRTETCRARWLVGCDGGRSPVREAAALGFERSSLEETFVLADALGDAQMPEDEGATVIAKDGVIFVVPMPEPGRWRIIAHLAGHDPAGKVDIDAAYVDRLFRERLGIEFGARDLTWTSQFVLKQGIATRYRSRRVFIAGDAAHLHSPVGGQGLNTGAQDGFALGWRLAMAQRVGGMPDALLDSYGAERRATAKSMVDNTSKATRVLTLRNGVLGAIRGAAARFALRRERFQRNLGRGVGMLDLAYADSPIVMKGPSGAAGPGGRLPDPAGEDGGRLSDLLDARRHTLLVLEGAGAELADSWTGRGLTTLTAAELQKAGLDVDDLRDALGGAAIVGVRPDRVIGFTAKAADEATLDAYAARLGVPVEAL